MDIEMVVVGPLQANCYVLHDTATRSAVIVDPGGDAELILETVRRLEVKVTHVVDTHSHFDHTNANAEVVQATGAQLAIHPDDAGTLTKPPRVFALFAPELKLSPPPTLLLREGDVIPVGTSQLTVLHTPGHSPGSISLWSAEQSVIFCGDLLFREGIGRYDFPGGNYSTLLRSIREKLFVLPDHVVVYPGHGPTTTIGFERKNNPFVA